jgi:PEGA domain
MAVVSRGARCGATARAISSHEMTTRVAAIVALAQLAATVARADPAADALALSHLERGVAAYRAGDFAHAHVELTAAQRLAPDRANPYRWLAWTESKLGDCRSALVRVESFLSRVPAADPRVAEMLEVRRQCTTTGVLHVESTPSGATIRIDGGVPLATTPTPKLSLLAGTHRLTIEKPGYRSQTESFEVNALGTTYARYALTAERAPLYRRWWFWAAVGAVAVATAGVTYGLTRDGDAFLPPVTCSDAGCRP